MSFWPNRRLEDLPGQDGPDEQNAKDERVLAERFPALNHFFDIYFHRQSESSDRERALVMCFIVFDSSTKYSNRCRPLLIQYIAGGLKQPSFLISAGGRRL
jgi:hypothetical protein